MGIDIRESPHQIECVHCGDCIDACEDVLRRIGRPGLIDYAWGKQPKDPARREPLLRRLGFRDAKRVAIVLVLLFYFCGLVVALSMRQPVLVRVAPDRTNLYQVLGDGRVVNRMRIRLANRGNAPASVTFSIEGLPGADLALPRNPLVLAPGESLEQTYRLACPPVGGRTGRESLPHRRPGRRRCQTGIVRHDLHHAACVPRRTNGRKQESPAARSFLCSSRCISLLFIGILLYAYHGAKEANPVMLDEHGQRPRRRSTGAVRHQMTQRHCDLCDLPAGREPLARAVRRRRARLLLCRLPQRLYDPLGKRR